MTSPVLARPRVSGLVRFEAAMLLRRKSSFVVVGLIALTVLMMGLRVGGTGAGGMGQWAMVLMYFVPIGVGVLLSDRLVRDRQEGLADLLASTPVSAWRRGLAVAFGSFIGPYALVAGTLVVIGLVRSAFEGAVTPLLGSLVMAVGVILPGLLLVASLAWLLALLLPLAVARVLIVGFWFWACMLNPSVVPVPSPTGTVLSPLGEYVAIAAGADAAYLGLGLAALSPEVTTGTAVFSALALLAIAGVLLAVALTLTNRRPARRS